VPLRALGAVWLLPLAMIAPAAVPDGGARIVVLDVGQGLAVFVATARHALLYDTGPRYSDSVDAGGRIVAPYLRAAGVTRLDALIVSHADSDHSGGALSILRAVPVARLVSSLPEDSAIVASARAGRATEPVHFPHAAPATEATPATRCAAGERWEWDGVAFEVLHPARAAYGDAARKSNDLSCVLRIVSAGGSALLTGDIEAVSEAELIARDAAALRADVLVVPHHGSRTSSTLAFVTAVSPRLAIIAAGYRNRFGHPRAEILGRYVRADAARARTDLQGAISVTLAPDRPIDAIAERERRRRYWYDAGARRRRAAHARLRRRSGRGGPRFRRPSVCASA
jgi:competence protein ComEC